MSILDGGIGILPRRLMVADRDLFMARADLPRQRDRASRRDALPMISSAMTAFCRAACGCGNRPAAIARPPMRCCWPPPARRDRGNRCWIWAAGQGRHRCAWPRGCRAWCWPGWRCSPNMPIWPAAMPPAKGVEMQVETGDLTRMPAPLRARFRPRHRQPALVSGGRHALAGGAAGGGDAGGLAACRLGAGRDAPAGPRRLADADHRHRRPARGAGGAVRPSSALSACCRWPRGRVAPPCG